MKTLWTAALLLGTTLATRPAAAQERAAEPGPDLETRTPASPIGLEAGAGLSDFTGSLGDKTNIGANWTVRGVFNFSQNLGLEAGYLGARNGIDDQRLPTSHSITTTALDTDLKLTAPLNARGVVVKPFVFGGLGAAYYGVSGGDTPLYRSDSDMQIPFGVGGDALFSDTVTVGARLGYQLNIANRIGADTAGNQYGVTATLGAHY